MSRPEVSLCLIVRDESDLLPRFLEHARGLFDELVAVDTGSRDATPRILSEAGARVLEATWTGDFAEARNVGLAAARGEWIAVLDPDELASPRLAPEVRALIADPLAGAATVRMVNALPHGHVRESRLLRLWRRAPEIRFRHPIHEDASEAVFASLAKSGRRLVHLEAHLDHLGYVRDRAAARKKKERDVGILDRVLDLDPGDLYAHLKRLEQARFWGDGSLWARAARAAEAAIRAAPDRLKDEPLGGELAVLMADGLTKDPREALALLDGLSRRVRPSAAFHLRRGELRERCGDAPGARAEFLKCLPLAGATANRQLATVRPLLGLARLDLSAGEERGALRRVEAALRLAPRDPEALFAAAALHRGRGGGAAVDAFCAAQAASGGPELWAAAGEEALRAGDLDRSRAALSRAAGDPPRGPSARMLSVAHLAAGDARAAESLAQSLAAHDPAAGLVAVLAALALGRDSAVELDLDPPEAEGALGEIASLLRAGARPEVLRALRTAAPALSGTFPWLRAALGG